MVFRLHQAVGVKPHGAAFEIGQLEQRGIGNEAILAGGEDGAGVFPPDQKALGAQRRQQFVAAGFTAAQLATVLPGFTPSTTAPALFR